MSDAFIEFGNLVSDVVTSTTDSTSASGTRAKLYRQLPTAI